MSDPDFDPYHEWLGIPPEEQPANHYRLLGLELFEDDRGVIEAVSLEQIAHVRTFAIGENSETSQLLLNELSAARVTLLNAVQKVDYDQELRQQLSSKGLEQSSATAENLEAVPAVIDVEPAPLPRKPQRRLSRSLNEVNASPSDPSEKRKLYIRIGGAIVLGYLVFMGILFFIRVRGVSQEIAMALNRGDYARVLELDPDNPAALSMQQSASDLADALAQKDYKRALSIDPYNAEALILKRADLLGALLARDFEKALDIDPNNAKAKSQQEEAAAQQAVANGNYRQALELDPTNREALAMKKSALAIEKEAEIEEALKAGDYTRVLRLDRTNAEALAMKQAAERKQGFGASDNSVGLELDSANTPALAMAEVDARPPPANAPFDAARAKEHQEAWAKYLGVEVETENSIGMKLSVIPPGTFAMGSGFDHNIAHQKPFMIGTTEVTQEQYAQVMSTNPSGHKGQKKPVERVSWFDASEFCRRLSALQLEKQAARRYRLPTEAEWEYACRAGTTTKYSFGDDDLKIGDYAWVRDNSDNGTHTVGGKEPNAWGLYDMHGNVWEWCIDWLGRRPADTLINPVAPGTPNAFFNSFYAYRGGSWNAANYYSASAARYKGNQASHSSVRGFRVVCLLTPAALFTGPNDLAQHESSSSRATVKSPPYSHRSAPPRAIAPLTVTKAKEQQEKWAEYCGVEVDSKNSIGMSFRVIPPGLFLRGSQDGSVHELPTHKVEITNPFMLGTHEVTQAQFEEVMGANPSKNKGSNKPVEMVSWFDAVDFCKKLNALPSEREAGLLYRLPTEAEWEYACRAGTTSKFHFGDSLSDADSYAWTNFGNQEVGGKRPNPWGLHDMHGNVWEWCIDWHGKYPYNIVANPLCASSDLEFGEKWFRNRIARGGSSRPSLATASYRGALEPEARRSTGGFRIACVPKSFGFINAEKAKAKQQSWAKQLNLKVQTVNSIGMKMQFIPPGKLRMGEGDDAHTVNLNKTFMISAYEVNQAQFERVMGKNPSHFKGSTNPVDSVSWNEAMEFCLKLTELPTEKAAGRVYRLPTESEWQYACNADTTANYIDVDGAYSKLGGFHLDGDSGWIKFNSNASTHPVGQKRPNSWGLFDMAGNVSEWCQEHNARFPDLAVTDPIRAPRKIIGSSWDYDYVGHGVGQNQAHRVSKTLGFRVVCVAVNVDSHITTPATQLNINYPHQTGSGSSTDPIPKKLPPLTVVPFDSATAEQHQEAWARAFERSVETENSIGLKLRVIPPGTFTMGKGKDAHDVTITKAFMLGTYEVTQEQYRHVMGRNPSKLKVVNNPVETVSWANAVHFCRKLSELPAEKTAGNVYRLPTEEEWVYACRAGTTPAFSFQHGGNGVSDYAWFRENSSGTAQLVGGKRPNAWGLYDMRGNVEEWCNPWFLDQTLNKDNHLDAVLANDYFTRGGSFSSTGDDCKSCIRHAYHATTKGDKWVGFRVAVTLSRN